MAHTKKHHWVPQFYLNYFAIPESKIKGQPQIWRFPKDNGDPAIVAIKDVAAQRHLYTPNGPGGRRDRYVDNELQALEALVAPLWIRIAENNFTMDMPFRKAMSLFMATLFLRHPDSITLREGLHDKLVETIDAAPKTPDGLPDITKIIIGGKEIAFDPMRWPEYRDMPQEQITDGAIEFIRSDAHALATPFLNRKWSMIVSDKPVFATSDNPVCAIGPRGERDGKYAALHAPGNMIFFPITPKQLLAIDFPRGDDGCAHVLLPHGEYILNDIIWRSAKRFLLTPWHPDETLRGIIECIEQCRTQ